MSTVFKESSENVFESIGFDRAEAAVLKVKSDLRIELETGLKRWKLNQTQAAKALGISRSRLNRLLKGHLDKISVDKLIAMHERLGAAVSVTVTPRQDAA